MTIQILMPALSPTMEEGTLAKWYVKEGDSVETGDLLAEIETDKATMEFEAVDDGVIEKILVAEGTSGVKINTAIAELSGDAGAVASPASQAIVEAVEPPAQKTTQEMHPSQKSQNEPRLFATPLARRIAQNEGIDLATIKGSGPKARIIKADVEKAIALRLETPSLNTPAPAPLFDSASANAVKALYQGQEFEEIPLDGMRKTIAERLTVSKQTIPHFYLRRSANIDRLLTVRKDMNKGLEAFGQKLSINDFIIKAVAFALKSHPHCNRIWAGDRMLALQSHDVAVAVSVEGGLFTPVLKDAHEKRIASLSDEMKELAHRARNKKLLPHEYSGAATAISNLGMFGIENFDAVINPPHASILAVGAGIKQPIIADDGSITSATLLSLTLSCDHRVIDGALGAEFLSTIIGTLENPLSLLA